MKQNISPEQLNELSDKGAKKLRKWWKPSVGEVYVNPDGIWGTISITGNDFSGFEVIGSQDKTNMPLLSIGQMIEFLDDHNWKENIVITKGGPYEIVKLPGQENLPDKTKRTWYVADLTKEGLVFGGYGHRILSDALWEACKDVLNEI